MQLQQSTEFALHGLLYLAAQDREKPVQLAEIAAATKIKESYLRKIFQQMVRGGILEAYKGADGGYALRRSADRINFYEVLQTVEGVPSAFHCLTEKRSCELHPACPILFGFTEAFAAFAERLKSLTLTSFLQSQRVAATSPDWLRQIQQPPNLKSELSK